MNQDDETARTLTIATQRFSLSLSHASLLGIELALDEETFVEFARQSFRALSEECAKGMTEYRERIHPLGIPGSKADRTGPVDSDEK